MMSNSDVEEPRHNKKNKTSLSLSFPLSLLPDELVLSCLARVSRSDYAALSLVSKRYRSLVVSPELYKTRSLLGYKSLYFCLRKGCDSTPLWFVFSREKTVDRPIRRIPSFPSQPQGGSSVVALNWGIYVIGGWSKENAITSDVLFLDCRTNTWRQLPSMAVARFLPAAEVVDGKIYVFGGCENIDYSNWAEVFDPKTQTWNTLVRMPDRHICLERIDASFVIEEKVYAVENMCVEGKLQSRSLYYSPSEGKWGTRNLKSDPYLESDEHVMKEKLLYSLDDSRKLFWCEKEEFKWKEVKGLDSLRMSIPTAATCISLRNFGNHIVFFWHVGEWYASSSKIWCADISLERRKEGDEIWGKVESSDALITLNHPASHTLMVLYSVSINL